MSLPNTYDTPQSNITCSVLFAIFVGSSIFFLVRSRQSNSTTGPTTGAAGIKHEEAGMAAGGAVPTTQQPATNTQTYTTQPMPQQPPPQAQYVQSQPEQQYTQTQTIPQTETVSQTEHVPQQAGAPTFVPKEGTFVPKEGFSAMPSSEKPPTDM